MFYFRSSFESTRVLSLLSGRFIRCPTRSLRVVSRRVASSLGLRLCYWPPLRPNASYVRHLHESSLARASRGSVYTGWECRNLCNFQGARRRGRSASHRLVSRPQRRSFAAVRSFCGHVQSSTQLGNRERTLRRCSVSRTDGLGGRCREHARDII